MKSWAIWPSRRKSSLSLSLESRLQTQIMRPWQLACGSLDPWSSSLPTAASRRVLKPRLHCHDVKRPTRDRIKNKCQRLLMTRTLTCANVSWGGCRRWHHLEAELPFGTSANSPLNIRLHRTDVSFRSPRRVWPFRTKKMLVFFGKMVFILLFFKFSVFFKKNE